MWYVCIDNERLHQTMDNYITLQLSITGIILTVAVLIAFIKSVFRSCKSIFSDGMSSVASVCVCTTLYISKIEIQGRSHQILGGQVTYTLSSGADRARSS